MRRRFAVAAAGIALAAITACGDTVTAAHGWYAVGAITQEFKTVNGVQQHGILINGPLSTSTDGGVAPGTLVREECVQNVVTPPTTAPYMCLLFINAGSRVYVASGSTTAPFDGKPHRLTVLTDSTAYIDVTALGATGRSAHLRLSARLPGLQKPLPPDSR